jgi:NADH dehydrogenase
MERRLIVVVGGGFAGVWAAMGARAQLWSHTERRAVGITLVSPGDALVVRPRLYESDLSGVRVPLEGVLSPVGIEHRQATVTGIDVKRRVVTMTGRFPGKVRYDQLVLCAGSRVRIPDGAYCADNYEQAMALHRAVAGLTERPEAGLAATVVGAGFTGLEVAAELVAMLSGVARAAGRPPEEARVRLIDQATVLAPEFGSTARAVIHDSLRSLGVEIHTGVRVSQVDPGQSVLLDGSLIDGGLMVWAAGPRASELNEQLGVELDSLGRVPVDAHMATGVDGVWAAGDSARVVADAEHLALMSCQHAMPQGRQAGENAAATVLGRSLGRYRQPLYLTCLDLGAAGALLTAGYDRDMVLATGEDAKRFKRFINRSMIYPPVNATAVQLLKLGKTTPPGRLGAGIERLALRSSTLRKALTGRGRDLAAQYSAQEPSS